MNVGQSPSQGNLPEATAVHIIKESRQASMSHAILYVLELRDELLRGLSRLAPVVGQIERADVDLTPQELRSRVTILITTGATGADRLFMEALPNLQLICCWGSGYEKVDLETASRRSVKVTHSPGASASGVADFAVALLLDSVRRLTFSDRFVREGKWNDAREPRPPRMQGMTGRKVGILGLGEIGFKIAQRLTAFELEVSYHNRRPRNDAPWRYFETLPEMARYCDCLVIALRADASNRHIVNAEILDALGPNGHVVNISRGTVIDESALAEALATRRIAGAGLDVFQDEPHVPGALRSSPHIVMAPHCAGHSIEAALAMSAMTLKNIEAFLRGEIPPNLVPELRAIWQK